MNIYGILENKIVYYYAPKCGSSTIFAYNSMIRNPEMLKNDFSEDPDYIYYKIINDDILYSYDYNRKNSEIKKEDIRQDSIKYCIVRNPAKRFISSFKGLILSNKYVEKMNMDQLMSILDLDDKSLSKKYPEKVKNGWQIVKHHFNTQTYSYGNDSSNFSHIFNMNQIDDIKTMLENYSNISLPILNINKSNISEDIKLSTTQMNWVLNKYSEDYRIYSKWFEE